MKKKFSNTQIKALKYLIYMSNDAGPETKKICFALIDASEGLTKPVYFTSNFEDNSDCGTHNMVSVNGTTHLQELLMTMGTKFIFCTHSGHFDFAGNYNGKSREGENNTLTIWLSNVRYDKNASPIASKLVEETKLEQLLYSHSNL